jgi:hypothetical protein
MGRQSKKTGMVSYLRMSVPFIVKHIGVSLLLENESERKTLKEFISRSVFLIRGVKPHVLTLGFHLISLICDLHLLPFCETIARGIQWTFEESRNHLNPKYESSNQTHWAVRVLTRTVTQPLLPTNI